MIGKKQSLHDGPTIAFYDREAVKYAEQMSDARSEKLAAFLGHLKPTARILELGCGGGRDTQAMIAAGFDVTPTDGSRRLARIAQMRLGRDVKVMRFDQLAFVDAFDAVWANACLLHVPVAGLSAVLSRIHRALRSGGTFYANYKAGSGSDRDRLGRYYNFPSREELETTYANSAPWSSLRFEVGKGGGYDGVERTWLHCFAMKAG
jgi:SAM-dependent methyltransferase